MLAGLDVESDGTNSKIAKAYALRHERAHPTIGISGKRPGRASEADFFIRVDPPPDHGRRQAALNERVSGASVPDPCDVP
jgi:hypothetical protein